MPPPSRRGTNKVNLALFIVALLIAIFIILTSSDYARRLHSRFFDLATPVLQTSNSLREQVTAVGQGLKSLEELEAENRQLLSDNRQLRARLQILEGLLEENNQLRDALGFLRRSPFRLLAARVISRDASTWWNTIRINRGFEDGVEVDMPVITEEGLVGKVVASSKNIATVLLITDENCKIGAYIEGSRERGIANGRRVSNLPNGELELNFLNKNAEVSTGARVLTVGVEGGVFPPDLVVGTVASFRNRELDGQAILLPAANISSLKDVFVILR